MFVQQFLPRLLVLLKGHISLTIVDLGEVFQVDVMEHTAWDMMGGVRKPSREMVCILLFNFCVF